MVRSNKTKIVATLGPASSSKEVLEQMIVEGVDVCRINFSHGSYEDHAEIIARIHEINTEKKTNIAILADLQGPKIRIGDVEDGVKLEEGQEIVISTNDCMGTKDRICINYRQFPADVDVDENVLIDDGKIVLKVLETNNIDEVKAVVLNGGKLSSRKGINLPNTKISLPCLTDKDKQDATFALEHNVHWLALSFVRRAEDILELKQLIRDKNRKTRVIAKIEKPEALENIDGIIEVADGLMVARGDLGMEVPMETVPMQQKMLVKKCLSTSKPVIIATQMMESMIENLHPSRAEVNDVANSVLDGADAVMLSGETSVGKYPVQVIRNMSKIINQVEKYDDVYYKENPLIFENDRFISDSICFNACNLAQQTNATAIITMTHSGYTAFKISSYRPNSNIYVFTENKGILCMLNLVWGVRGFYYDKYESTDNTIQDLKDYLKRHGFLKEGELVINIASMPIFEKGKSNMLKLSYVQ